MKKHFLFFSLLGFTICSNAQSKLPEGGQSLLEDKPEKAFKAIALKGNMESKTIRIKDQPEIKTAIHLSILEASKENSDLQLAAINETAVNKGDVVMFTFYARRTSSADKATTIGCVIAKTGDKTKLLTQLAELGQDWKAFYYPVKTTVAYKANDLQFSFLVGSKAQEIELANIQVLDFKTTYPLTQLPTSIKAEVKKTDLQPTIVGTPNTFKIKAEKDIAEITKIKNSSSDTAIFHINVPVKTKVPEEVQIIAENILKIDKGDILLATFKARALSPDKTIPSTVLACNFESGKSSLTRSMSQSVVLDTAWRNYSFPFESIDTYESGAAMFDFYCGGAAQTIEITDLQVLNYRKSTTADKLPRSKYKTAQELENAATETYPAGKDPVSNLMTVLFNAKASGQKITSEEKDFSGYYQLTASSLTENPKDIQCFVNTEAPIKKGDVMLLSFYARSPKAKENAQASISVNFGKATPNYDKSLNSRVTIGPGWKLYNMPFIVLQDFDPNTARLSFCTGSPTAMQTIEIANVQLVNYKKTKKVTELPQR